MTDLISRADAVKTVIRMCSPICEWQDGTQQYPDCVVAEINKLPSAELPKGDLISRADAIEAVKKRLYETAMNNMEHGDIYADIAENRIDIWLSALPSADADGEDLIIKGAKGIQDGLYNIKDGKLFKYKAKGGTVRTYPIVPSADAVPKWNCTASFVAEQLDRLREMTDEEKREFFKRFFEVEGGDDE